MELGAQLYTLRDYAKDLDGFADCLKRVAEMGYKTVQVSGTCAYEPGWLAEQLRQNGLRCVLTHIAQSRITDHTDEAVADHKVFGCQYIGLGCGPNGLVGEEDLAVMLDIAHTAGQKIHDLGCQLMYHNHHLEFNHGVDGRTRLEALADSTTAEELGFTLDTYWIQFGGGDPADWIGRLRGRVPCVHFKDMAIAGAENRMAAVGAGNLNFDRILSACEDAGTQYILIEQDNCYGESPFDCLEQSYRYLNARGLC